MTTNKNYFQLTTILDNCIPTIEASSLPKEFTKLIRKNCDAKN